MPNGDFEPMYSTNNIWYDTYTAQCLTNHLEDMGADIDTLQAGKANVNHTHNEYSPINHEHSEYALVNHSHTGYALIGHTHSYNDLEDKPVIPTTLPANGGNSDTVDGKHAADFATVESVDMLQTLVGSTSVQSQISTAVGAITPASIGAAEEDHVHNYNDLINKPTSLPANGGNADTVDGKHASDFATAESMSTIETLVGSTSVQSQISNAIDNHTHSYNNLTDKPTSLPANGGNADTVDNKHASDFATVESVDMLQTLVGTTSVQSQITTAIDAIEPADIGAATDAHTHSYNDLTDKPELNIQPDWDQNTESSADYIKNRTHWSETALTEVVPETTVVLTDGSAFDVLNGVSLIDGQIYTVIWDSIEYECLAQSTDYGDVYIGTQPAPMVSSTDAETNESDKPFYIATYGTEYSIVEGEIGSHTFRIRANIETVHKLDEKYLPHKYVRQDKLGDAIAVLAQTSIKMKDRMTGYHYVIEIINGEISTSCCATNMYIQTYPSKRTYLEGESLDLSDMVVCSTCENGEKKIINCYDVSYDHSVGAQTVTVSYEECGTVYTDTFPITITSVIDALTDFDYTTNDDGTYTITAWKGTLNGEPSTEIVVPNSNKIIIE